MSKKTPLTIEVYTDEGVMHESIGGPMSFEDVRATMISVLKNDGIPVIRAHGKHAKLPQEGASSKKEAGNSAKPSPCPVWEQPMSVHIEYDGVKFAASGKYEDVMDAQAEFLKAIFEED